MSEPDIASEEIKHVLPHSEGIPNIGIEPGEVDSNSGISTSRKVVSRVGSHYGVIVVWILMVAIYAILLPGKMLTHGTLQTIFGSQQSLVFLSMALVVTFIAGEFDLSVAANMGLSATIIPVLVVVHNMNIVEACVIAVAVSVLVGVVNGIVIVKLGVNAIVVTLGMATFLLGIALWISNLQMISGLSTSFSNISLYPILGLPISFYYGLILAIAIAYFIAFTPTGRHMTFVGANPEVARLAGVRVDRIRIGAYVTSGLICGVGGLLLCSTVGGFDATTSPTYLLPAFAATFLGTAVIQPGRFNALGSLVGIYFLITGVVGLELLGYAGWISDVFYGLALVIAVTISTVIGKRTVLRT